jgi:hypothetical protein
MASLRERSEQWLQLLFPWAWRLAVLALPWQTRLFWEGPTIAGYPWEQGRISIYASWIVMLLAVFIDWALQAREKKSATHHTRWFWVSGLVFILFTFITTSVLRSTIQWWLEVIVLILFFRTLFHRVFVQQLLSWFVLSLIPHALLGVWQAIDQQVVGYSFLGMASQQPITPGVAVIETGGVRWLRSYGGFPHPNIFGGWLVLGILSTLLLLKNQMDHWRRVIGSILLALFSVALVLSYSRSAWIALCVGLFVCSVSAFFSAPSGRVQRLKTFLPSLLIVLVGIGITISLRPQLVFSRAQLTTRLEQKSVSERKQGIENAIRILHDDPVAGSGLGASAWETMRLDGSEGKPSIIPVPPHVVPLLGVAELGFVGLLLGITWLRLYTNRLRGSFGLVPRFQLLWRVSSFLFLIPILLLDHYSWSYWSGKMLLILSISLCLLQVRRLDEK